MKLVSCVTPTQGSRMGWLPFLVDSYLKQTYQNKELVILGDVGGPYLDEHMGIPWKVAVAANIRIHYCEGWNIPRKRNYLAELAKGEIIIHFDDDDWSHPDRIQAQIHHLKQYQVGFTGFHSILFWSDLEKQAYVYQGSPGYACGTSFCYLKAFIRRFPFPVARSLGSDNDVVYKARDKNLVATHHGRNLIVANIHQDTSNYKDTKGGNYVPIEKEKIPEGFWAAKNLCDHSS